MELEEEFSVSRQAVTLDRTGSEVCPVESALASRYRQLEKFGLTEDFRSLHVEQTDPGSSVTLEVVETAGVMVRRIDWFAGW